MKNLLKVITNIFLTSIGLSILLGSLLKIIGPINQSNKINIAEKSSRSFRKELLTKKSTLVKNPLLTYSHLCAIVSYYLLIILFLTFNLQNLQINLISKFIIAIVQISPLLPFIKGLHALHFRSMIWLCFLSLVYFVHGIMNALSGAYNLFGWSEIIFSLLLFISLAVCANTCKRR